MELDDLSRYDGGAEAVDRAGCDGVILNVEDPGILDKALRARDENKPVLVYTWVYPGGGVAAVDRAIDKAATLTGYGVDILDYAFDYEQNGVQPQDLRDAIGYGRQHGLPMLAYTYLFELGAELKQVFIDTGVPLWIAFYPGSNDGSYPAWAEQDARATGAVLWQYTSSNGTRDRSIILSAAWFESLTGTQPIPSTPVQEQPLVMDITTITNAQGHSLTFWTEGHDLYVRGWVSGNPGPVARLSDQASGGDLLLTDFMGQTVGLTPAIGGKLIQITPTAFGPHAAVI
ncbi:MAG TPA: hypothetical protein VNM39_11995 [Verrucomicrobiae bacterium]|nr:hypothetical protein [Verrucomicrobiae bacterium]